MDFFRGRDTIPAMKLRNFLRIVFLFGSAICFAGTLGAQKPPSSDLVVISNVNVVDVRSGAILADQTVILQGSHIASIDPSKSAKAPRNATTVNGRGYFLIPGLWDMHVHLVFGDWFPGARDITLPMLIANGVTGVRDMGSELETVQDWRHDIGEGRMLGPRIRTSGPMLDGPKPRFPSSIAITTPEDGR